MDVPKLYTAGMALVAYASLLHDVVNEGFTVNTPQVQAVMMQNVALITSTDHPTLRVGAIVAASNCTSNGILTPSALSWLTNCVAYQFLVRSFWFRRRPPNRTLHRWPSCRRP